MRTDRAVLVPLAIVASVLLLGVAVYLPLMVAWLNRGESDGGKNVFVKCSWPMRQAAFLYVPLMKFHASMCGYYYFMSLNHGEDMIFIRSDVTFHN